MDKNATLPLPENFSDVLSWFNHQALFWLTWHNPIFWHLWRNKSFIHSTTGALMGSISRAATPEPHRLEGEGTGEGSHGAGRLLYSEQRPSKLRQGMITPMPSSHFGNLSCGLRVRTMSACWKRNFISVLSFVAAQLKYLYPIRRPLYLPDSSSRMTSEEGRLWH